MQSKGSMSNYSVSRIKRSVKHPLKLISVEENNYNIYGSTGNIYTIKTEPSMSCTCIDYNKNKRYCKHIYFIFLNIYKTIPQLDKCYTTEELKELHNTFFEKKPETCARNDNCCICFEELDGDNSICGTCKNGFHKKCIHEMIKFSKKSNCPLCRSNLLASEIDDLIKQVEML